jgi:FlaA1/EpsC-like NDP-sugar epimerase
LCIAFLDDLGLELSDNSDLVGYTMASKIAKFYAGRSVFITGGSGFVGKQIVEKLLRSCPEIDTIYLLMRAKKGQNVQQRLNNTFESPVSLLKLRQHVNVFTALCQPRSRE